LRNALRTIHSTGMNKSVTLAAVLGSLSIAGVAYWLGTRQAANATPPSTESAKPAAKAPSGPPPTLVEAALPTAARLPVSLTAVGTLRSDESVMIRPEIAGRIAAIGFSEGQRVRKGALLVKLDAALQSAEVEQTRANVTLARSKYERAIDLQKKGFISPQALDEASNTAKVAEAALTLASARLARTEIRAPFDGIVGLRSVSIGDYVKEGQDIVNLEEIDPLKADFRVPEIYLREVRAGQALQLTMDALPNKTFEGKVLAINPALDANGRSIVVRAVVKNTEADLRPGMFARVRLLTQNERDSILIAEDAVVPVGEEKFIFRVVDGRAQRQKVETGQRRDGKVEILAGIGLQDRVITQGQFKIRDGAAVRTADAPSKAATAAAPGSKANETNARPPMGATAAGIAAPTANASASAAPATPAAR
jgi:membrane fusion protein, multidrug efflux system